MGGKWTTFRQMGEDTVITAHPEAKLIDSKPQRFIGSFQNKEEQESLENKLKKTSPTLSE